MMDLDADEVVRLYVEEQRSVREIADHFGTSYARVYHILRYRVQMRSRGEEHLRQKSKKHDQIKETMRERIIGGDWKPRHKILNNHQLAQIFGVGQQTIERVVADLREQGYLHCLPRGTYVRPPEDWPT
jgi:transposase